MKIKRINIYKNENKKAQGHVEFILSFVIFLVFVAFLLFFLNPLKDKQLNNTLLDNTVEKLLENWTIKYDLVSVTIDKGVGITPCLEIKNVAEFDQNIVVHDEFGDLKNASISSNAPKNKISIESFVGSRFYRIYSSDFFEDTVFSTGCKELEQENFTFGSVVTKESVLYENLVEFIEDYEQDYESLRQELNLQNDFEVYVYKQNNISGNQREMIMNASRLIPKTINVVARDIPLIAVNKTLGQENIIINIRAW